MLRFTAGVLIEKYGPVEANKLLMVSGFKAGMYFAKEYVCLSVDLFSFIRQLQRLLHKSHVGELSVEKSGSGELGLVLKCSMDESTIHSCCESFLGGMMEAYIKGNSTLSCYTIRLTA